LLKEYQKTAFNFMLGETLKCRMTSW